MAAAQPTVASNVGKLIDVAAIANNTTINSDILVPKKGATAIDILLISNTNGNAQRQYYLADGTENDGNYKSANWRNIGAPIAVTGGTDNISTVTTMVNVPNRIVYTPSANPHTTKVLLSSH